jgi:predicted Zn-dependent peptidase
MNLILKSKPVWEVFLIFTWVLIAPVAAPAQNLADFEKKMTEFTLDNGLKFLVFERHEAPVVSFRTMADVGSVNEVKGITGLAHLFEHLAFKGTKTIGTTNYQAEAKAIAKEDKLFEQIKAEQQKGTKADKQLLEQLQKQFEEAQNETQKYRVPDEFEEIMVKEGGEGFNAFTSKDYTGYIVSLPSNKLEFWMALESDRFANPVLREFFKEKDVIMEERRMRTENDPEGRLYEEFVAIAFLAHPYGEPIIGHMSDIQNLTRQQAEAFFKKYYCPSNLTVAIVGDVNPQQVRKLAEKYFAGIPGGSKPGPVTTIEPPQRGRRQVTIYDQAQPELIIGYHQTNMNDPNSVVFKVLDRIIGTGRTSWLYKSLVKEKKIAISANTSISADSGWSKYPGLFTFWAVPANGHTNKECEEAIDAEIEKLKTVPVTQDELSKAKTQLRAELIRLLEKNDDIAEELTYYEVVTGNWRNLFNEIDKIQKVTADDIQRVVRDYFIPSNCVVGAIETSRAANSGSNSIKN